MLSEQIKELRNYARIFDGDRLDGNLSPVFKNAADTIEALSAKLAAANMERSELYYGGGWIPCSERFPELYIPVLVSDKKGNVCIRTITSEIDGWHHWSQDKYGVLAWMPLPEPYKPDGEVGE